MAFLNNKNAFWLSFIAYALLLTLLIIFANGTGGNGDSVMHYYISKYAFKYPSLLLDHWAKPLFVALSAPFAQFGFVGIKIFNSLAMLLAAFYTFKISLQLNFKNGWCIPLLFAAAPQVLQFTLSGLTEPLCAAMLAVGIYWYLQNKPITATIMLSFLPFVRSEGLIIILIIGLYLVVKKLYKIIPLLAVGHIFYSLVGSFHYKDILWVFTKIPYVGATVDYGNGTWIHYIKNMPDLVGLGSTWMIGLGLLVGFWQLIKYVQKKEIVFTKEEIWLVFGIMVAFSAFHIIAWRKGLFHSFGLLRVFIAIFPLLIIIVLKAFNAVQVLAPKFIKSWFILLLIPINIYGYNFSKMLWLDDLQKRCAILSHYTKSIYPDHEKRIYYFQSPYFFITQNIDKYNWNNFRYLNGDVFKAAEYGSFVVWDDWYAKIEGGVLLESLEKDPLHFRKVISVSNTKGNMMILFERTQLP
jgi:hypothetical protein